MGKKAAVSTKPKNQKKSASSQKVVKAPARQSKPTSFNVQTHPFVKKLADNGEYSSFNCYFNHCCLIEFNAFKVE